MLGDRKGIPGELRNGVHVRVLAASAKTPAVVFEAGLAGSCLSWHAVQTMWCDAGGASVSYDRRGYGWTPRKPGRRTLHSMSDDLRAVTIATGTSRPFVLVGHSFGCLIARVYASRFPDDISRLVLVDPPSVAEWTEMSRRTRWRRGRAVFFTQLTGAAASIGLVRLGLWGLLRRGPGRPGPLLGLSPTVRRIAAGLAKLPQEHVAGLAERWRQPAFFQTMAEDIAAMPRLAVEAARCQIPPHLDVVVLSGAHQPAAVIAEHRALATRHVMASASGHWIQLDEPNLVIEAIGHS